MLKKKDSTSICDGYNISGIIVDHYNGDKQVRDNIELKYWREIYNE